MGFSALMQFQHIVKAIFNYLSDKEYVFWEMLQTGFLRAVLEIAVGGNGSPAIDFATR